MKPKTQLEKRVWELSQTLPLLEDKWIDIAIKDTAKIYAYRRKNGTCHCLNCGDSFEYRGKAKTIKCPHCGRLLHIEDTTKNVNHVEFFWNCLDVQEEFQVVRGYYCKYYFKVGQPYIVEQFVECSRSYISPKGSMVVMSCPLQGFYMYRFNPFITDKNMTIQRDEKHSITCNASVRKLIPQLKRYGYKNIGYDTQSHIISMLTDSHYQTLMQAKRYDLVDKFESNGLDNWWWQCRMCLRLKYIVNDVSMWVDTLRLAELLELDLHSPKYVCPEDLQAMHDMLLKKNKQKDEVERKLRLKEQLLKDIKEDKAHEKRMAIYVGMMICGEDIVITPLTTIKQFFDEGEAMHHCVYTNHYYRKKNCLILSAKDSNGNRLATIEYDLKGKKIAQCRAACNKIPERYDDICNLIMKNKHCIEKYKRKKVVVAA